MNDKETTKTENPNIIFRKISVLEYSVLSIVTLALLFILLQPRTLSEPHLVDMVDVPSGIFKMGSDKGDENEKPIHSVNIENFKLGVYEVTREQFATFVYETGYLTDAEKSRKYSGWTGCHGIEGKGSAYKWKSGSSWKNPGFFQGGRHPVVCVSYNDASAFIEWLSNKTGLKYRLPSESEWEYASRAGTVSSWYWGFKEEQCKYANGADLTYQKTYIEDNLVNDSCHDNYIHSAPTGSFKPNSWGLYDVLGNASEWVEDCINTDKVEDMSYADASRNGGASTTGNCSVRILRGGQWTVNQEALRVAYRLGASTHYRAIGSGFRLALD